MQLKLSYDKEENVYLKSLYYDNIFNFSKKKMLLSFLFIVTSGREVLWCLPMDILLSEVNLL